MRDFLTALKKNDERGMGENVGAVTALEYATRKKNYREVWKENVRKQSKI